MVNAPILAASLNQLGSRLVAVSKSVDAGQFVASSDVVGLLTRHLAGVVAALERGTMAAHSS